MAKASTERYYSLQKETVEKLETLISKYVPTPIRLGYEFIGDMKLKKLIKATKVKDDFAFLYNKQVLLTVNEAILDLLESDETGEALVEILFREELNQISVNSENGKIKIEKPNFTSTGSIIEKYSFGEVKRAKDMELLVFEQIEDKAKDTVDIEQ